MNVPHSYDEESALRLITSGNEAAFKWLYGHYRDKVYFIAWKLLKSNSAAEDVLQEVFARIWNRRENLAGIENFNAYLNAIIRNHIYNVFRKRANEALAIAELAKAGPGNDEQTYNSVILNELQKYLKEAVAQLPLQQRKVFQLSRVYGLKHEEIAEKMQISTGTVKKHMMMSLRSIKEYLTLQQNVLYVVVFFTVVFN